MRDVVFKNVNGKCFIRFDESKYGYMPYIDSGMGYEKVPLLMTRDEIETSLKMIEKIKSETVYSCIFSSAVKGAMLWSMKYKR